MSSTPTLCAAELAARLHLHSLPAIGALRFRTLLETFGDAQTALQTPPRDWRALGMPESARQAKNRADILAQVDSTLHWLQGQNHHLLMWDNPNYPALLAELPDAPSLLFVDGDSKILERPQLALVGSRQASAPGLDNAHAFAKSLAAGGFVITSGLALGIDGAAHQGALDARGQTVAVLGTGLGHIYPRQHLQLADDIRAQGGALVSELPLDSPPKGSNFPRRNRLISGLSLGVLVIEASPKSGSLITARLAAEQGRAVWALPGSIHHPGARGCHQLIRQGAALVECTDHILEDLRGWQLPQAALPTATRNAAKAPVAPTQAAQPLLDALCAAPASSEALAQMSGLPLPEVLALLTELEIEGRVESSGTRWLLRPLL